MTESDKPSPSTNPSVAVAAVGQLTVPSLGVTSDPNSTSDMIDHLIRITTTCREQLAVVNDGLEGYDHIKDTTYFTIHTHT